MSLNAYNMKQMNTEQYAVYQQEVSKRSKSTFVAYLLYLVGFHYGYIGQWGTQLAYWFTVGGLGIWSIVDIFRIPGLVERHNDAVATEISSHLARLQK